MTIVPNTPVRSYTIEEARQRLLRLWLVGLLPFGIILIQTLSGKYGTDWQDLLAGYNWIAPILMPVISLMIGTSRAAEKSNAHSRATCNMPMYDLCWCISVIILASLVGVPVVEPFVSMRIHEMFLISSVILTPLLMILSSLVLMFFT